MQPLYYALNDSLPYRLVLAFRIVFAALACFILVLFQKKTKELISVLKNPRSLEKEIPASIFLFLDWAVYIFAINEGKVLESTLGYCIMPIVMVAFGSILYNEKLNKIQFLAIGFVVIGIIFSYKGFGGFPIITISLAFIFAIYSAIKKSINTSSIVSTTCEILIMSPFALLYILVYLFKTSDFSFVTAIPFLFGSGICIAVPMILFAIAVANIPLTTTGVCEYISPILSVMSGLILGEVFTKDKTFSYLFVIIGVIIYALTEYRKVSKKE